MNTVQIKLKPARFTACREGLPEFLPVGFFAMKYPLQVEPLSCKGSLYHCLDRCQLG